MSYKKQSLRKFIPGISSDALNIIKKMFKINPAKRPSASQLLSEPYFKTCNLKESIQLIRSLNKYTPQPREPKSGTRENPFILNQNFPTQKPKVPTKSGSRICADQEELRSKQTDRQPAEQQTQQQRRSMPEKSQTQPLYIPNYMGFQPGIEQSIRQELDKPKYEKRLTDLQENFQSDFGGFKGYNRNLDDRSQTIHAYPMRKDEPQSFTQKMEQERRKTLQSGSDLFVLSNLALNP
jgi:serine/threonine protein kinase